MGNKIKVLPDIEPLFYKNCDNFYDMFGGSGTVVLNVDYKNRYYNELNPFIYELFEMFTKYSIEELYIYIENKIKEYNLISVKSKHSDDYNLAVENFNKLKSNYNKNKDVRDLYILSCFSINHLIRFNSNKEFNVFYGTDSSCYHENRLLASKPLFENKNIILSNKDYRDMEIKDNSFVYLDPPYYNTMAVYNEDRAFQSGWTLDDEYSLYNYLENLDKKNIKWGLSNSLRNDKIIDWANSNNYYIKYIDHPFSNQFNNRFNNRFNNDRIELFITNYDTKEPKEIVLW